MKTFLLLITIFTILTAGGVESFQEDNGTFHIFTLNNKDEKITPKLLEDALKNNAFIIGQNADIGHELKSIFNDNNFKIYTNISFYHKDLTIKILKEEAKAGILLPMGIVMYQNLGEENLHIVIPRADMFSKVIGTNTKKLQQLEDAILTIITTLFPTASHSYSKETKTQVKELFTSYALNIQDSDFEDAREELEERFEKTFEKAGFAMPSYFDVSKVLGEDSIYDFYVTYAICKLDVLRVVAKTNPQLAALGPCTTIMYKKKNEDKIVMGFASIYNWTKSIDANNQEVLQSLLEVQKLYENILKEVTKN